MNTGTNLESQLRRSLHVRGIKHKVVRTALIVLSILILCEIISRGSPYLTELLQKFF
jgi:hypothetical protein